MWWFFKWILFFFLQIKFISIQSNENWLSGALIFILNDINEFKHATDRKTWLSFLHSIFFFYLNFSIFPDIILQFGLYFCFLFCKTSQRRWNVLMRFSAWIHSRQTMWMTSHKHDISMCILLTNSSNINLYTHSTTLKIFLYKYILLCCIQ